jgi:hypothetical protein
MRTFFIGALDKLIALIIVLGAIAVVIAAVSAIATQGFLPGLLVLVAGTLYVILIGGMMYLFLGIYYNTKRTAEALDRSGNS